MDEPDYEEFQVEGFDCKIIRIFCLANSAQEAASLDGFPPPFGGYLCGYLKLPEGHSWYGKKVDSENSPDCDIHGGLTYSEFEEDGYWIGFDCCHSSDLIPSSEKFKEEKYENPRISSLIKEIEKMFFSIIKPPIDEEDFGLLFKRTYRNLNFVKCQLLDLANQAKLAVESQK